jgi:hypothetical protein
MPVTLAPGRPTLTTSPLCTGSLLTSATIGIRGLLGVRRDVAAIGEDQIGFELHQFCGEGRKTLAFAVGVPVFDLDGFPIDVTEHLQALNQGADGVDLR